ncbi:MAG: DJ-1/PfpI family protein [Spirochaetia bacterium]
MKINTILFDDFETLDVFGPVEIFGRLPDDFTVCFYSQNGGLTKSVHGARIATEPFAKIEAKDNVLFIPGGSGTRPLVKDREYIQCLKQFAAESAYIFTVCTGSILFSKTGLLEGKKATSNKRLFQWTGMESPAVKWIKNARWVKDGNIYTSSGISAGMDMALGFVADILGDDIAVKQSIEIEYNWHRDKENDPFANMHDAKI